MALDVRTLNCAGPGTASTSPPEAPEPGGHAGGGHAGGALAEFLDQPTPKLRRRWNKRLRDSE
eukprot:12873744-Alexandrium_andersonii.AAC.1